jgi:hypothetical protein
MVDPIVPSITYVTSDTRAETISTDGSADVNVL